MVDQLGKVQQPEAGYRGRMPGRSNGRVRQWNGQLADNLLNVERPWMILRCLVHGSKQYASQTEHYA